MYSRENLYKSAIKAIEKVYNESKWNKDVDFFRISDIINSINDNQLASKEWIVEKILPYLKKTDKIFIMGSWYGVLGHMLSQYTENDIIMYDVDPMSKEIGRYFCPTETHPNCHFRVGDAIEYYMVHEVGRYHNIVINTSVEHMEKEDIKLMSSFKAKDTLIVMQSNNYHEIDSHINTYQNLEHFEKSLNLRNVLISEKKKMSKYDRYFVVGK